MKPSAHIYKPNDFLTIFVDGKSLTIRASDSSFNKAVEAFANQDWETLVNLIDPSRHVAKLTARFEDVEVRDNTVFYKGDPVHGVIVERILQFRDQGLDMMPLVKFLAKLMLNPSKRAVDELYSFLEHKNLPITDNGNFLAYKGVDANYWSIHSGNVKLLKGRANNNGHIFNGIGEEIQIPRNQVDDNKEHHCSYGLHAGTLEYANGFRSDDGKVVIVEIDPADVVSIPSDCECQKLRTCRYKVVDEYKGVALSSACYTSNFRNENDEIVDGQFDYDDDEDRDEIYVDELGDPMVDGGAYVVANAIYLWYGDDALFVNLNDPTDTLSSDLCGEALFIDEDKRVDSHGEDLVDGELYRDNARNIYRWDATNDKFERIRPNDKASFGYLESVLMYMELVD
jgi:hypothetical protein